jgi:hypothetical protein
MTRTERETLIICPDCSTSETYWGTAEPVEGGPGGFTLVDGAWTGRCPECRAKRVDASNAEYEALVRAAAELGRVANVGPLSCIEIPVGEGFWLAGERVFGFWAIMGVAETPTLFTRNVRAIVGNLNLNRGITLLDNVSDTGTQAIVHGVVD